MTLTDARLHPWLAQEHLLHGSGALPSPAGSPEPVPRRTLSPELHHQVDASMRSVASDRMALDHDHGEPMDAEPIETGRMTPEFIPADEDLVPSQRNGTGLARQPSRLRRRVDVILSAHTRGEELPSPSQEMRERAAAEEAQDENENGAGPSRANKRKAALDFEGSLTPMEEEEEDEEEEEPAPTPARGRGAPAAKRGRGAGTKKAGAATPAKRGRGRAAASAVAAPPLVSTNGDDVGLRRSHRLNQGTPVKANVARRA